MQDAHALFLDYLSSHTLLSLATVDGEGRPRLRSLEYVNDGTTIYIATDGRSPKVEEIRKQPSVAFTVDEDLENWTQIQGIQMSGEASVVEDSVEAGRAMALLMERFPQIQNFPPEFKNHMVIVRICPTTGLFIDNPAGWGTRHVLDYTHTP